MLLVANSPALHLILLSSMKRRLVKKEDSGKSQKKRLKFEESEDGEDGEESDFALQGDGEDIISIQSSDDEEDEANVKMEAESEDGKEMRSRRKLKPKSPSPRPSPDLEDLKGDMKQIGQVRVNSNERKYLALTFSQVLIHARRSHEFAAEDAKSIRADLLTWFGSHDLTPHYLIAITRF